MLTKMGTSFDVGQRKNSYQFEELCFNAVSFGLSRLGMTEEEFEEEFATLLNSSLSELFLNLPLNLITFNKIVDFMVNDSHGLICRAEAIRHANKIFSDNKAYLH